MQIHILSLEDGNPAWNIDNLNEVRENVKLLQNLSCTYFKVQIKEYLCGNQQYDMFFSNYGKKKLREPTFLRFFPIMVEIDEC